MSGKIIFLLLLIPAVLSAQYTSQDKELVKTVFTREFNKDILDQYLNSKDTVKINAAVLAIMNSDFVISGKDKNPGYSHYFDFLDAHAKSWRTYRDSAEMISALKNDKNIFNAAFRIYRSAKIPDDKIVYVEALKKAIKVRDVKSIPYLLGILRKLKYFPDDKKLADQVFSLKQYDIRVEAVKVLPYYVHNSASLKRYVKFFDDKNENIIRQAAISVSEISNKSLFAGISEFISGKIKNSSLSASIKNELLLSYIRINKSSFKFIQSEFGKHVEKKGLLLAAGLTSYEEGKTFLLSTFASGDYHDRLYVMQVLEELNKDSSITFVINDLKKKDPFLTELMTDSAKQKVEFEKLWSNAFKYSFADIVTTKGTIKVRLLNEYAPMSVANFCSLALEQFFNGNLFHRVVPGFVIQTGDTTNTGWGGPGYSIVSEFSQLSYSKGVVGMASSGRDTEGSQWFITTGNYPHLDEKYTVFGEVISGLPIAEKITPEDKIIEVRLN